MSSWIEAAIAFVVMLVATPLLARLARRVGFGDDPRSAPERKLQSEAVPAVGGVALALALGAVVCARLWTADPSLPEITDCDISARLQFHEGLLLAALAAAFGIGFLDDLLPRGLSPLAKLSGQIVAGILVSLGFGFARSLPSLTSLIERVGELDWLDWLAIPCGIAPMAFLTVLAQNLVNTWDNADGAATSIGALGLTGALVSLWYSADTLQAPALAALLVFLPFNLLLRRRGAPVAYLGDSGSHLLGVLLVAAGPVAWLALWLPLVDLLRLSWVRLEAGSYPWVGDRRHLGHRLQARLGPVAVAAALTLMALPAVVGGAIRGPLSTLLGLLISTLFYLGALAWTRDREGVLGDHAASHSS